MFGTFFPALGAMFISTMLPTGFQQEAIACDGLITQLPVRTLFHMVSTYHVQFFSCVVWTMLAACIDIWALGHYAAAHLLSAANAVRTVVAALFIACITMLHAHGLHGTTTVLMTNEWLRIQTALNAYASWLYFPEAAASCGGQLPIAFMNATAVDSHLLNCANASCRSFDGLPSQLTVCCIPWSLSPAAVQRQLHAYASHVFQSKAGIGLFVFCVFAECIVMVWLVVMTAYVCCKRRRRRARNQVTVIPADDYTLLYE